ncbi:carboxypeptidase-like regulatory domain-containing protein [Fodinibius halophilus]|uniref:Carboxypeptidase regulatory-like domain-containing protein n=1 Tax=Fodinibius halophilus TaxID=1736908 RepID=A0A6M1T666_9BACT|nr:carboxypeptidase-like regulatory domain-containing protein [Fodinibius halophilus]NGP89579.1 carboxypeptidase regulatory-like domain-containing protein [Fodinibius halophilus]
MKKRTQNRFTFANQLVLILGIGLLLSACSPSAQMLNRIPVNKVSFKVVDADGQPLKGATVESNNGNSTATNADGTATIRFGSVGIHTVSVFADNHTPSTTTVTLPSDRGETKTIRLAEQVTYSGNAFAQMGSTQMYTMMFRYLFNSYGYSMELADYKEGEWTKWQISSGGSDDTVVMKKAFLKENEDGQQWWQIQMTNDGENTYTAEVLFDKNKSSIRRYREKVGDNEPQEKPVTENWYSQPNQLTEESIEGAITQKNTEVTVPKGTFTADLITYGVVPEINLKIWRVKDVPGGTVRYETVQEGEETIYGVQLIDYGDNAQTQLNSF